MSEQFTILVVCLGNVCRSPLAERLLRMRIEQMLGDGASAVRVSSAGVRALVGDPMNESSAAELRRLGGDPDGFVSSQVTAARATEADLVLTEAEIRGEQPGAAPGAWGLFRARLRRLRYGLRDLPRAARIVWRERRRS